MKRYMIVKRSAGVTRDLIAVSAGEAREFIQKKCVRLEHIKRYGKVNFGLRNV